MQDTLEKLELMKRCDLSRFTGHIPRYTGIGSDICALRNDIDLFAILRKSDLLTIGDNPISEINVVTRIYAAYGSIVLGYASLPFEEMDPKDNDFKSFFVIRDLLPQLGKAISDLLAYPQVHQKFGDITDSPPYQEVLRIERIISGLNLPQYRVRIEELEARLLNEERKNLLGTLAAKAEITSGK